MPKVTGVTASRSLKINLGSYESSDVFVSITAEPEPGEDFNRVMDWALAQAQRKVKEQEAVIRNGDKPMKVSDLKSRQPRLPNLGAIRKGGRRGTSAKGRFKGGDDLAYFRVEFLEGDQSQAAKAFKAAYGEQPTSITVWLPYADVWKNWRVSFEAYDASGTLLFAADGDEPGCEVKFCREDPSRVGTAYMPGKDPEVGPRGRLAVIIEEVGRIGTLDFATSSKIDVERITDALLYYFSPQAEGGMGLPCSAVPLKLYRRPEEITVRLEGQAPFRKTYSLVQIEIAPEWVQQRLLAQRQQSWALARGDIHALGPGDYDDYEDFVIDGDTGEVFEPQLVSQSESSESDEPAQPAQPSHWIDDAETRRRFWAFAKGTLGLSEDDVYRALSVESVHAFKGDKRAALELLEAFAESDDGDANNAEVSDAENLDEWFGDDGIGIREKMWEADLLAAQDE